MLNPISLIENLLRTVLVAGAILIAAITINEPSGWFLNMALVTITCGFFSFILAFQFLIALVMKKETDNLNFNENARSFGLFLPFMIGLLCYFAGAILICLNYVAN